MKKRTGECPASESPRFEIDEPLYYTILRIIKSIHRKTYMQKYENKNLSIN